MFRTILMLAGAITFAAASVPESSEEMAQWSRSRFSNIRKATIRFCKSNNDAKQFPIICSGYNKAAAARLAAMKAAHKRLMKKEALAAKRAKAAARRAKIAARKAARAAAAARRAAAR